MASLFSKMFPTPRYLQFPAVGLDVSDHSIKFAELANTPRGMKLVRHGRIPVPDGVIKKGAVLDQEKFIGILKEAERTNHFSVVHVSLPEEQVYLFTLSMPRVDAKDVAEAIELSLEEHIPIAAAEAIFDYNIIAETDETLLVEVVAARRTLIERYVSLFREAGIAVFSFELEVQAMMRAAVPHTEQGTCLIADFGETSTGVSIIVNGLVQTTASIDMSGTMLSRALADTLKIPIEKAEDIKRTAGLDASRGDIHIKEALIAALAPLVAELSNRLALWHSHQTDNKQNSVPHQKIERIYIAGGNASMPGFAAYLSEALKLPVVVSDIWNTIPHAPRYKAPLSQEESLEYATALGLAVGALQNI